MGGGYAAGRFVFRAVEKAIGTAADRCRRSQSPVRYYPCRSQWCLAMHFSIPETEELLEKDGTPFLVSDLQLFSLHLHLYIKEQVSLCLISFGYFSFVSGFDISWVL